MHVCVLCDIMASIGYIKIYCMGETRKSAFIEARCYAKARWPNSSRTTSGSHHLSSLNLSRIRSQHIVASGSVDGHRTQHLYVMYDSCNCSSDSAWSNARTSRRSPRYCDVLKVRTLHNQQERRNQSKVPDESLCPMWLLQFCSC